ncbi:AI-2E family transporter [Leifsonia sp. Leaf264]|uniref:AI-2E family transporter n=1 Tax=Leifsonia sp. Leaf264 TaxID=1736314 RepID=UPI0006F76D37|nr:AI-2E family transporter [Leifsonia sp. Leaf264]KQO98449.1 permease [Leifsonia sp. Leaf264]
MSTPHPVPTPVQAAASWAWRILVIVAAAAAAMWGLAKLSEIVIPVLIAILLGSLLVPVVGFLKRKRWPAWAAVTATLGGTVLILGGLVTVAVIQIIRGSRDVAGRAVEFWDSVKVFLHDSPLGLTNTEINGYVDSAVDAVQSDSSALLSGAMSVGSGVGHVGVGLALAFFTLLFILIDGPRIWSWIVTLFPARARTKADGAGKVAWATLSSFAKIQVLVAGIDALGIGLGAALLGVPMAVPIAILVFMGAFIPVVGALVAGAVAVILALLYSGPWIALWMLVVIIAVQQLEGHILQPLVMGNAVKVHPLAVVLAVAVGSLVAGIPGALFAVPVAAVVNVVGKYLTGTDSAAPSEPTDSETASTAELAITEVDA